LDRKEKTITLVADSEYCLQQIQSSLRATFVKRKLDPLSLDFQDEEKAGGNTLRQLVKLKEGIDQENAKRVTKFFKQSKLKVQASIQGDEIRVSGKSRDDLQAAIQQIKGLDLQVPLQFINFRD
ncbi:MAG: nucleotide-binding protein, partial [Rickettsiales bacterium]|nr:nucleotide-binding protein [Rickettsiales bacterium]